MDRRDDQEGGDLGHRAAIAAALRIGGAGNIESTRDLSLMSVALAFGCCVLCVRMVREYYSACGHGCPPRAPAVRARRGRERAVGQRRRRRPGRRRDGWRRAAAARRVGARARAPHAAARAGARPALHPAADGVGAPRRRVGEVCRRLGGALARRQARVLLLCAKERHRLPDSRLVALLEAALEARAAAGGTQPASPALGVRPAKDRGGRGGGRRRPTARRRWWRCGARGRRASAHRGAAAARPAPRVVAAACAPPPPPRSSGWAGASGWASSRPPRTRCSSRWRVASGNEPAPRSDAHRATRRRAPAPPSAAPRPSRCARRWRRHKPSGSDGSTTMVAPPARRARRRRRRHADAAAHRTRRRRACGGGARGGRRRRVPKDDATAGGDDRGRGEPIQGGALRLEVLRCRRRWCLRTRC